MSKRFFLMLAHPYKPDKHGVGGWLLSEKLDGMRCFWDGGVSRRHLKTDVPWANNDKDGRYKTPPRATGLWSRYGNIIHAPDWFLDDLPPILLDGELFTKRQDRQNLMSIVKDLEPGDGWERVKYYAFDSPPPDVIFEDGLVGKLDKNFEKDFYKCLQWFEERAPLAWQASRDSIFGSVYKRLQQELAGCTWIKCHEQEEIPMGIIAIRATIEGWLDGLLAAGGEGVILRDTHGCWVPERTHTMVKVKKYQDDEATVTGYTTGRETDKGSKYLGMMGALVTNYKGRRFELSGFTDEERELVFTPGECLAEVTQTSQSWARENAGSDVPDWIQAKHFPRGTKVTFKYRDKSDDDIPQEASYFRKHQVG